MTMTRVERPTNLARKAAGRLAESGWFARGRALYEQNCRNWLLPLSRLEKLLCGGYLILRDYAAGTFPPRFEDPAAAYQGELNYRHSLPGLDLTDIDRGELAKPFWDAASFTHYTRGFVRLLRTLERLGVPRHGRLLELGCGGGWMAEFFALAGYSVVGSTLVPEDIRVAQRRVAALQAKGLTAELSFVVGPMESIDRQLPEGTVFDGVFVYEALHHAFDWRQTLAAAHRVLKPGGWFVLANEPNRLHTFTSYRVGLISNTHEIGMNRRQLVAHLKTVRFSEVRVLAPRFDNWLTPLWLAARK